MNEWLAATIAVAGVACVTRAPLAARASLTPVAGGQLLRGDPRGERGEEPRRVDVSGFAMMRTEVTTAQFAAFVAATGHVTDAERAGVGHVWWRHDGRRWSWRRIAGADWRHPHGPGTAARGDHAVVQVSARDAAAFCAHHGLRLPTEDEWEWAARGADGRRYVWGDAPPERTPRARLGNVGTLACCAADDRDGHLRVAPVARFPAARSWAGVDDLVGNVWEWTTSPDERAPGKQVIRGAGWGNSSWCLRAAYRHSNPPDRGLDMVGFRCVTGP
jgi:sulfatase modifying factor 1